MPTLAENMQTLNEIRALKDNWDNNGAKHFSQSLVGCIKALLQRLPEQPNIFPTVRDSIQLEYRKPELHLVIEILEDGRATIFRDPPNTTARVGIQELPMYIATYLST